ncbi:Methyl methanesulfonate-sensitivity protein 22 [Penicillium expansum]|uniref:Methyl methanesulfonate-sensitivity protein 22 n=1 Tax=Penicillium expansum TaxID=27334 RepID=A0A0A2JU77_PENEN|nr:Methyl methanesulfonate-sensitivity protein 22 [Penicillium expansum]KGO58979.1 Methyl methanesulfonate-sensitivity protein 22 [Penicillium expansum]
MESWRQRGYVPDSDEEDGFDSLDTKKGNVEYSPALENLEYIDNPSSSPKEGTKSVTREQQEHIRAENGSITLSDTEEVARRHTNRASPQLTNAAHDETTPKQRRGRRTYGLRSSATKSTNLRSSELRNTNASIKNTDSIYDFPMSSQEHDRPQSKPSSRESTPKPLKTAQPSQSQVIAEPHASKENTQDETSSTRSSSPDELMSILQPPRKKKPVAQYVQPIEAPPLPPPPPPPPPQEASDDDSPLSSVPSSIGSPPANDSTELHPDGLMEAEPERPADREADLRQTVLVELDANRDDVLPHLDIPEEVLRELPHAAQRTFRKRNAIQLHPYYLEQVKFAQQLQARGVKPFGRPVQQRQQVTDESQGQDSYDPNAPASSPPQEEYLPPIRHERHRGLQSAAQGREHNDSEHSRPSQAPLAKRQKTSHFGTPKERRNLQKPSKPRGIRDKDTATGNPNGNSIYELSSSPPHAGRLSSTSRTPRASEGGFRFPRGWSPPGEVAESGAQETEEAGQAQSTGLGTDDDQEVQSISSNSTSDQEETKSEAEEREIRRYQRMTRGALPASHARLDQKKIADREKASQLDRHASSQRPDGKGVARRLIRKGDRSRQPATQQPRGLFDLGDSDSDDEDNRNVATENASVTNDSSQRLTGALGLEEPLALEEGDISEDNRIDYMLGTVPRNSRGPRHKTNSLKRPKSKQSLFNGERQPKRARQTRMTDASYGTRRTKKPSAVQRPRIGILDAPDVATKPRTEHSRLLRIATRRPRLRKDGGRQSPTQKFVKLASREDTMDANESLRDWRRGAIRQAKISPPRSRAPQHRHWETNLSILSARAKSNSKIGRIPNQLLDAEAVTDVSNTNTAEPEHAQAPPESSAVSVPSNQAPVAESSSRRKPEQHGNTWVIPRNVALTSLKRNTIRPAATSLAGPGRSQKMVPAMFNQSLSLLNRHYKNQRTSQPYKPSLTLDRYVSDSRSLSTGGNSSPMNPSVAAAAAAASAEAQTRTPTQKAPVSRRRLKKHPPNRINLDADEFRQNPDPAIIVSDDSESPTIPDVTPAGPSSFGIGGLFNWQRFYPVDFGVPSLRDNTFFHESTFIGSGEFSRSLRIAERDFDGDAAPFSIQLRDETFQWSRWNDTVSSEMGQVFDVIIDNVERGAVTSPETGITAALGVASRLYRLLIKYITGNLVFIDPVDRTGFVTRAMGLVSQVRDPLAAFLASDEYNKSGLVKIACFNMIFSNQIYQVASHRLVSPALATEALDLVKTSTKDVAGLIASKVGSSELKTLFKENNESERRESGIRDEYPSAEAYVATKHLLRSSDNYKGCFEDLQLDTFNNGIIRNERDVGSLEAGWRGIFTVLPLNEIDLLGIARPGYQLTAANDNWKLVKRLLAPALDHFESNSKAQPFSYNSYCRTLFLRCHRLINSWGWRECKPILDTLFDFFAKNTLHNLKLEEARGSPSFLDELDSNPSLDARVGEPCFHTFLKIVASGLRFLAKRYDKKKIRNFAWRLLPNHGRVYPKEQPLQHEDLDALRNHHDLLSTLYWAVPDGCRPRLETIRNLVHPATSHREACSINLRSWSRLVRFKLSTDEEVSGLDPFGDWYGYFVTELQQQHSYARKEIEAQNTGDNRVSQQLVERTISQNQRQIETLLSNALSGLRIAVQLAPKLEHAHRLVLRTPFESILTLFNPKLPRVNVVVSEALQVLVAYTQKDVPVTSTSDAPAAVNTDEDSQEFGDWDAIQAVWDQQSSLSEGIVHVQQAFHPIVSRLVSNCFGEDHCPEDAILLNVVECWTSIAQVLIRHGLRDWDNYLSEFGDDSWTRLRQTVQTRKFAPLFLAACIEKDPQIVSDCRIQVMSMWMSSLVERSSMLKFQHRLTEALLNGSPTDPLLANLPFFKDKKIGRYTITLEEIGSRRLSLLSSLSSNMREQLQGMELSGNRDFSVTKQEYSEVLQRVMTSMKDNYQELGNGTAQATQGEYVEFVQRVIGFLQQHTSDIKPIDPFFTDPASFPLPSTDPRYIVAKLKRYESKLSSSKEIQTLTGFIQSISERAAIDGQQGYLVDQLHTSMKDTYEAGYYDKPTLRAVLLQCVFPAYLEATLSNRAAWILSRPIIQTITLKFKNLLCNIDTLDAACVSSVIDTIDVVCRASSQALGVVSLRRHLLQSPITLLMLAAFLDMISSALPVVDYIDRTTGAGQGILTHLEWIRDFSKAVSKCLQSTDPNAELSSSAHITFPVVPSPSDSRKTELFRTANNLTSNDLQVYLRKWSHHQGKYYFTRPGHESQEITIEPEIAVQMASQSEAQKAFDNAARGFVDRAKALELLT